MSITETFRPTFYEGQFLGSADLTAAVQLTRVQDARHALGAHTWGIAAGLTLREMPALGQPGQVEVQLQPGFAWDGFGRPVLVPAPRLLTGDLFASIVYDSSIDTPGSPGRRIEVWIRYDEGATQPAASGFETCDPAGGTARVRESFQIVVGPRPAHADRHDAIDVAGRQVDAELALQALDPTAPLLYDESVAYQGLPEEQRARWLIPVGYVRWKPSPVATQPGALAPADPTDAEATRLFRRYIGVVAETVAAASDTIHLRRRTTAPSTVLTPELACVEGDLRVDGDVRVFGGGLEWRDTQGADRGVPLTVRRVESNGAGGADLRITIGAQGAGAHRLALGRLDATGAFLGSVFMRDDGRVGIGTGAPTHPLHVTSALGLRQGSMFLSGGPGWSSLSYNAHHNAANGAWVFPDTSRRSVTVEMDDAGGVPRFEVWGTSTPAGSWTQRLHITADTGDVFMAHHGGRVGIGTTTPRNALGIRGVTAAEDLLSFEDAAGTTRWHVNQNTAGIRGLNVVETGVADGRLFLAPGALAGINTMAPDRALTVESAGSAYLNVRTAGRTHELLIGADFTGGIVSTMTNHDLQLRAGGNSTKLLITAGGDVGVGTTVPVARLHVEGARDGDAAQLASHIAVIDNTSAPGLGADVLALRVARPDPRESNNFVTFFGGNTTLGRIEGLAAGNGVGFRTGAGDFAESLPRRDPAERIEHGDVVGVFAGRISRSTLGAQHVSVVTDQPAVAAGMPDAADGGRYEDVALVGQVRVRVRGPVRAGDLIVPSGAGDGIGVAVPRDALDPGLARQVVGEAWESSDEPGIRRVNTAIGFGTHAMAALEARVAALGTELRSLEERI